MAWIGDLDGRAAADALAANHAAMIEAEVTEFVLAAHWADLHAIDPDAAPSDDPYTRRALPGTERAKRLGGLGTPEVGEFAAAELGTLLHRSPGAGTALIADALDVRHRLPMLWEAVLAGRVRVWQARQIAKRTRQVGLTGSQAAWVDARTTPYLASLPWTRFWDLLEAKIIEVDPAAAQARAEAAALDRFVATGQSNEHGLKTLIAKAEAGAIIYLVAVCDRLAQILALEGDTDPIGPRRSKALTLLANPAHALRLLEKYAGQNNSQDTADQAPADTDAGEGSDTNDPTDANTTADSTADATDPTDPTDPAEAAEAEAEPDEAAGATDEADGDADEVVGPGDLHPAEDDSDDPTPCPTCGSPSGMSGDPTPFTRPAAADLDPAKLLPKAILYVHVSREAFDAALAGHRTGVARLEGVGPLTLDQAAAFLRHSHVDVTEVLDLETDHPVDGYEVPDRMREQLRLRSPAQVFPYTGLATRGTDADHTKPYLPPRRGGPPGQTRIGNLGHLGRHPHRIKTHANGWRHRQPQPGVHLWRSPHGYRYRVDNTGTHALGKIPQPHPDSTLEHAFAELIDAH